MDMSGQPYTPATLYPEDVSRTHRVGYWVSQRASLVFLEKRKAPFPSQELRTVDHAAHGLVTTQTELSWLRNLS